MNSELYKKVLGTIKRYDMLKKGDRVLVGVSGGPDSVFLLDALYNLKNKLDIDIFVANLNHAVRGKFSAKDSNFVKRRAAEFKLQYVQHKLRPIKKGPSLKLSMEEALREKRYEFFKEAAKKVRANVIATGHTLDDQAETVLMRTIKGSTIKGLTGIPPVRRNGTLNIIRPLIELEKKAIINFLVKNKIPYRLDHTNLEEDFFRNKVRRKIMPYLERFNPRIKRSLSLMAESLREDRDFIEEERKKRKGYLNKNGKCVSIKLKDIVIQPKALQREILRDALMKSGANIKKLTFRHWKDMDEFLKYKRKGQSLDMPGGVSLKRYEKEILFKKRK